MPTLNCYVPASKRKAFDKKLKTINPQSQSMAIRAAVDFYIFCEKMHNDKDLDEVSRDILIYEELQRIKESNKK
tara:strand:- start:581 stop:802 length:222 start_codon:yes stop_codon:yes gene_type:complete